MKTKLNQKVEVELINNKFTLEEAKHLIFQLLQDKINFHVSKNFSHRERTGVDCNFSSKRLNQLTIEKERLKRIFVDAEEQFSNVKISCDIQISFD